MISQSRYINERAHANIQKDGTYLSAPRMWAGRPRLDELRAIANGGEIFDTDSEGDGRSTHRFTRRKKG
ncbi:MAG: hypothetical protein IPO38_06235 [Rhodocyclaceae bacterium]|nr:hypothetical protein [Rhodocyclaceae bacterium]